MLVLILVTLRVGIETSTFYMVLLIQMGRFLFLLHSEAER